MTGPRAAHRPTAQTLAALEAQLDRLGVIPHKVTRLEADWIDANERQREIDAAQAEGWLRICPPRFRDRDLGDLDGNADAPLTEVLTWLAATKQRSAGSLLITGPKGAGKTLAAVGVLRELHFTGGFEVAFVPVRDTLHELRPDGFGRDHPAFRADVLVLDDVGAERSTEYTRDELFSVIDTRWLQKRATIVTTNLTPEDLESHIGERAYDRLRDDATCLLFGGESHRRPRAVNQAQFRLLDGERR